MKGNGNLQTMSPRRADWKLQIAAVAPVHAHGRRCKPFWAIEVGQRVLDYHLLLRWAWAPPSHCNSHSNLGFSFWTPSKLKTAQSRASATIKHLPDDRFQGLKLQASFVTSWYLIYQCFPMSLITLKTCPQHRYVLERSGKAIWNMRCHVLPWACPSHGN